MPAIINRCPECDALLSDWEQTERECFTCGWSEHQNPNDTTSRVPPDFEFDREIDDENHD